MFESYISIIVELCISLVLCLLILLYFARKKMNLIIFFTSLICWFMNLFFIILIPYDVYYSQKVNQKIPETSEKFIDYGYQITYWVLFILSWFIIPIMKEYECSGEFRASEKLKQSLRSNIKFFIVVGVFGLFGIFYCLIAMGLTGTFLLVKNFSLIYGIIFYFFLLSYGIIKYPKTLYMKFKFEHQINYLEWKANNFIIKLKKVTNNIINKYSQLNATIDNYKGKQKEQEKDESNEENKNEDSGNLYSDTSIVKEKKVEDYIDEITTKFEDFKQNALDYGIDIRVEFFDNKDPIQKYNDLIKVNREINSNQNDSLRLQSRLRNCYMRWARLKSVFYYTKKFNEIKVNEDYTKFDDKNNESNSNDSDKIEVKEKKNKEQEKPSDEEEFIPLDSFSDSKVLTFYSIKKYFYFVLLIISIIAGIITVLWEFYIVCGVRFILVYKNIENIVLIHFMILIPLIYLISMSNYTLFKIKFSSYIYLFMYGPRQTDSISLITFTSYLSRIYFAICINYMQCINQFSEKQYNTRFETFFELNTNYFLLSLCRYYPLLLFIFIVMFYFNIPGRIMYCCGKSLFEFDNEKKNSDIENGHKYLMSLNKKLGGKNLEYNDIKMFENMD